MTYPISKIEGLSAADAKKLKSLGLRTTDEFLDAAQSPRGRKTLAAKTGFSEQQLLEWANIADYMRIPGLGNGKAKLLRASGVTTVREFTHRNPARLAQTMRDVNIKRKLVSALPSEKSIGSLIDQARKLPLKITY